MLIGFNVRNYRSFKTPACFSMVAAKFRSQSELQVDSTFLMPDSLRLLKTAAIYGANASGKSNLIKAFDFVRRFVLGSSKESQITETINVESFLLNIETENAPSEFEVTFYVEEKKYRYGFIVDKNIVHNEWLYHTPTTRESYLFIRSGKSYKISKVFKEGRGLEDKTRNNALFLSVVAQFNGPIAQTIVRWFGNLGVISGLEDYGYRNYTIGQLEIDDSKLEIVKFIKSIDTGISDIRVLSRAASEFELPKELEEFKKKLTQEGRQFKAVVADHKKYTKDNSFDSLVTFDVGLNESEGTQKILFLAGPLFDVLRTPKILVIDELDARLHPHLTSHIISLFNSEQTNSLNAQLIFATHDTNLLRGKHFRRDQIWFTEKDRYGATDLYSLAEYPVRYDAQFEKDYIQGKYGAIPFIVGSHNLARNIDE